MTISNAWHSTNAVKGLSILPFKGKGQIAAAITDRTAAVTLVRQQMMALVDITRSQGHRRFALGMVRAGNTEKLLWRLDSKNGPRRIWRDPDFQALLSQQQDSMRQWYWSVNEQALALNCQMLMLVREQHLLSALLLQLNNDEQLYHRGTHGGREI